MAPSRGGGDADGWSAQTEQAAQHEGGSDVRDAGGTDRAVPTVPWQSLKGILAREKLLQVKQIHARRLRVVLCVG